jgi:integrase
MGARGVGRVRPLLTPYAGRDPRSAVLVAVYRHLPRRTGETVEKWEVRAVVPGPDGVDRQVRRRYATQKKAVEYLNELISGKFTGTAVAPDKLDLGQAIEDYLAEVELRQKATTHRSYTYALRPVVEQLGHIAVQKLTKRDVEQLVKSLRAGTTKHGTWKATSVNPMLARLRAVLGGLVRERVLSHNVADLVRAIPVPTAERYEAPTWTETQVAAFCATLLQDRLEHVWHLGLCGLRRGELGGMRWEDVDFKVGTIAVRGNRTAVPGGSSVGGTKTIASERVLPLPANLAAVLKRACKRQKAEKLAAGPRYRGTGEWVVCDRFGRPLHPDTISDKWSEAVKASGLPYISLHPARHTALTLMHLNGVPTAVIAAWAGHRDAAFTVRQYTHAQPDALKSAAAYLSSVVIEKKSADAAGEQ